MIKRTPTLRTELDKMALYGETSLLSPESLDILRELHQSLERIHREKPIVLSDDSEEHKKELNRKLKELKSLHPQRLDFTSEEQDDVEIIEPIDIPYERFVWKDLPEDESGVDDILDDDQMEIDDIFNEDDVAFADALARVQDLIDFENAESSTTLAGMNAQLQDISDDQSSVFDDRITLTRKYNPQRTYQDFRRNLLDLVGASEEIPYDFESPALMEYFSAQGDLQPPTREVPVNFVTATILDVSDEDNNLQRPLIRLPGEVESDPDSIVLTESQSEIIDLGHILDRMPEHHRKYLEGMNLGLILEFLKMYLFFGF